MTRSKLVRTLHIVLSICTAMILCAVLAANMFKGRSTTACSTAELVTFGSAMLLFTILPLSGFALFLLNRKCKQDHAKLQRVLMTLSSVVCLLIWLSACPIALIGFEAYKPWPITQRHGPDTSYARNGFEACLEFSPPACVSGIYYCTDGFQDPILHLRFDVSSPDIVDRIVSNHKLTYVKKIDKPRQYSSSNPAVGKWWEEMG